MNHDQWPSDLKSLYIHWPFCPYKCHFCDFVALASHEQYMQEYHGALVHEIESFYATYPYKSVPIETIYLGGGTPSTYPPHLLLDMMSILKSTITLSPKAELSIEINPGTITPQGLQAWQDAGINRVSIGVQSLNEQILKGLNRHQSTVDVQNAIKQLSEVFTTVSIDLIIGLPGISREQWQSMIHTIVQWPISHISMYFLMVHENTPLYFGVKKKAINLPCDDDVVDMYYWTIETFERYSFNQYEISSFAKPGFECKHNKVYWHRKPFKGFGLGAWSFDGIARIQNEKNLMKYMQDVNSSGKSILSQEIITREQRWVEKVMLGLRQRCGVSLETLQEDLSSNECELLEEKIKDLCQKDYLEETQGIIRLLPRALSLENEIITQLSLIM